MKVIQVKHVQFADMLRKTQYREEITTVKNVNLRFTETLMVLPISVAKQDMANIVKSKGIK